MEGDVAAAIRVLSSSDTVVSPSPEVLEVLKDKHPDAPVDLRVVAPPTDNRPRRNAFVRPLILSPEAVAEGSMVFAQVTCGS